MSARCADGACVLLKWCTLVVQVVPVCCIYDGCVFLNVVPVL
jgi:hypothetical protein